MKFLDPLACLQFMGGPFPFHLALAVILVLNMPQNISCDRKYKKYINDDIKLMLYAHILSLFETFIRRNIQKITGKKLDYLKHSLGILNMLVYFCCILFTQFSKEMEH